MLVAYSDSEGSDGEEVPKQATQTTTKSTSIATTNFAVDKANPKKIRVNLTETLTSKSDHNDGEPAAKRPRIGAGAFSGFNAMLPPPKQQAQNPATNGSKAPARKVFSLKTGAEPAFSRDSDTELRDFFATQDRDNGEPSESTMPATTPTPTANTDLSSAPPQPIQGKQIRFMPLSVSRNKKTKKPASSMIPPLPPQQTSSQPSSTQPSHTHLQSQQLPPDPPRKISLFSSGPSELPPDIDHDLEFASSHEPGGEEDEIVELLDEPTPPQPQPFISTSESLTDIASSLNLSAAERRQLFGRSNHASTNTSKSTASKIVNFNTDVEYAANQAQIAAGEQVQHNPVRAIATGKHSLKSLVANAQGQKEALEESFASGRRNKREAGSKYGW